MDRLHKIHLIERKATCQEGDFLMETDNLSSRQCMRFGMPFEKDQGIQSLEQWSNITPSSTMTDNLRLNIQVWSNEVLAQVVFLDVTHKTRETILARRFHYGCSTLKDIGGSTHQNLHAKKCSMLPQGSVNAAYLSGRKLHIPSRRWNSTTMVWCPERVSLRTGRQAVFFTRWLNPMDNQDGEGETPWNSVTGKNRAIQLHSPTLLSRLDASMMSAR